MKTPDFQNYESLDRIHYSSVSRLYGQTLFSDFTTQAATILWQGERDCVVAAKEQAKMYWLFFNNA